MSNLVLRRLQLPISAILLLVLDSSSAQTTFWKDVNSPTSEGIFRILATGNATLFAASDSSGIFRSTEEGLSWTPANSGLTDLRIRALTRAQDGSLIAGGLGWYIFRSTNNGSGWVIAYYTGRNINDMAVSPTAEVYTVGSRFAWRSTNHGANWSLIGNEVAGRLNFVAITPQGWPYMGGYPRGVNWTPNGGQTWSYMGVFGCQLPFPYCGDILAGVTSPSGTMFVGNDGEGISRSTGDLWT
jgi:hypothetical protein